VAEAPFLDATEPRLGQRDAEVAFDWTRQFSLVISAPMSMRSRSR
jgi:hypothetical protein